MQFDNPPRIVECLIQPPVLLDDLQTCSHGPFRVGEGIAALEDGQTLQDLADEADVEIEEIKDALGALRSEEVRERIETALEEGNLTDGEAEWLLEGLDNGYLGKLGNFFSKRGGRGGQGGFNHGAGFPNNDL